MHLPCASLTPAHSCLRHSWPHLIPNRLLAAIAPRGSLAAIAARELISSRVESLKLFGTQHRGPRLRTSSGRDVVRLFAMPTKSVITTNANDLAPVLMFHDFLWMSQLVRSCLIHTREADTSVPLHRKSAPDTLAGNSPGRSGCIEALGNRNASKTRTLSQKIPPGSLANLLRSSGNI